MTRAITLRAHGGVENLLWESVDVPAPTPGQLLIRHTAIAVNFHDTYVRTGLYKTLALPGIPGLEAAGVVEDVGAGVSDFAPGDRIVYTDTSYGAYAERRVVAAALALKIPADIPDDAAAALNIKGMTACVLLRKVTAIKRGTRVLIHAGAGGMGQLLVSWAKHLGAFVIATAGSAEKADIARARGADHVILYREESFPERVKALTDGKGVDVVYDSVGKDTFAGSLESLDFLGHLVNFGQSSGPVAPLAPSQLAGKSLTITRPMLFHYVRDRAALLGVAEETFAAVKSGIIRADIGAVFPLREAGKAHELIESRASTGSIILRP